MYYSANTGGNPQAGLNVYAFDSTTYTGYNKTTDASGLVTFTLPMGDYRFRADKDGVQYWSGTANHCTVPGCTAATVTVSGQAMWSLPGERTLAVGELPDEDALYRPPGLASSLRNLPSAPLAQTGGVVLITRVITQAYDPLDRLVSSDYSTGESFTYEYDAVGNRRVFTSTTPLSGTLVTTYTFDAANRLAVRSVSDGRDYTYTWSQRGQLLAENTQGVDVRTFTYDGAGRLVEATVFTLTTRFHYNGLGARTVVEVVGQGTMTVTLDYAANNRILAETTITGTTQYLYGADCLGQYDEVDAWLYYHHDGDRMVRQGTDADGEIVSTWLFDPDGTLLEGPNGPVSHLICGGVYDWSSGLIYKNNNYFDPTLGIWLALTPLVVVQSWRKRKKGWRGLWSIALVLSLVGVSGALTGCGGCKEIEALTQQQCTDIAIPEFVSLEINPITDGPHVVNVRDWAGVNDPNAKGLMLSTEWTPEAYLYGVQFIGKVQTPGEGTKPNGELLMVQNAAAYGWRKHLDGSEETYGNRTEWRFDGESGDRSFMSPNCQYSNDCAVKIGPGTGYNEEVVHDLCYDAPGTIIADEEVLSDLVEVEKGGDFEMYLMWQPTGTCHQCVLASVEWSWQARVVRKYDTAIGPQSTDEWDWVTREMNVDEQGKKTNGLPVYSPPTIGEGGLEWIPATP